jgi:signal transduction histidine kinase
MNRRLLIVLSATGVAVTVADIVLVLDPQRPQPYGEAEDVGHVVVNAIFIAAGLIAWWLRPADLVGPLMTALGFVEQFGLFYWDESLPFTVATTLDTLIVPLAVHLFVVFPNGRCSTRFERTLVIFTYAAAVVIGTAWQLSWDPRANDCPDCPSNLFLVARQPAVFDVIDAVAVIVTIAVFITLAVLLVQRVRRSRGPTRRALAPVLIDAVVVMVALAGTEIAYSIGSDTAEEVISSIGGIAFAALPILFLVGVLRTRLQRSAVADLVVELGSVPPPTPVQVRDAIARTLRDQSLQLAFWLPDSGRYVGPDGQGVDPEAQPGQAVTVLDHDGQRLAALIHDPALLDDAALVRAVGAAATLTLENARLQAELRAQLTEVRASRVRILEAGDAERRRLERDLHDGAQQRLLGIRLALQLARGRLTDGGGDAVDELLAEADSEVTGALHELRALARGIHPALLSDEGLDAALAALARRVPVPVHITPCGERLPASVEATAYFVASEALANVVKHAHASRVRIAMSHTDGHLAIEIIDDGIGGADTHGAGLRGLRDRVEALDGTLHVDSNPGHGTTITAELPCA